jgi:uncharacterized protein (TIGR03067 family)
MALLLCGASLAPAADDKKEDKDKLQGKWKVVKVDRDWKVSRVSESDVDFFHLVFAGDKVRVELKTSKEEGTYKIDPKKKVKTIDFMPTTGDDKGRTLKGIYELKDDDLKICVAQEPQETDRPEKFKSSGSRIVVYYLTRVKK